MAEEINSNVRGRMVRAAGRILLVLQAALILLCLYGIVDAYVTPYKSEWLTADAFVPHYVIIALFCGLGILLTWSFMRSSQRRG